MNHPGQISSGYSPVLDCHTAHVACKFKLKGHPCKVVDYSTSKTGKHGHAKAHIIGIDIFTGKKCEDLCPTSHNMSVPNVNKDEYTVMDVGDDGTLSLLTAAGEPKDDLNLPDGTDESKAIA